VSEQDTSKSYQEASRDLTHELIVTAPLYLLVPVLFAALALIWEIELSPGWILLGAVGWLGALFLRVPVAMITQRLTTESDTIRQVVILSSGPAEELVRLAIVLITAANLDVGYAIGLTLLLAFQPLLVLVTMPLHSLINYGFIVMMRRRVNIAFILLAPLIIGLVAYSLGLVAMLSS